MSDCPDCEETGSDMDGDGHPFPCRNWRHRCRPSLEEIAVAIHEGREPSRMYMLGEK